MITRTQLRIRTNSYGKIKKIAENQNRSVNKQIEFILEQFIETYEKVNGELKIEEK